MELAAARILLSVSLLALAAPPAQAESSGTGISSTTAPGWCETAPIQLEQCLSQSLQRMPSTPLAETASQAGSEMIKQLQLQPLIDRIRILKQQLASVDLSAPGIESLTLRLELYETKQSLLTAIMKATLEVDYVIAAIDGDQNRYTEQIADLMSRRDQAVWNTTILSQWSNGLLWSASSAFTCASVRNPRLSYPDGILGILAGAIPTGLSLYAMHQSHGGKVDASPNRNMLAPVFLKTDAERSQHFFPHSVQAYLATAAPERNGTITRKEELIERWQRNKYIKVGSSPGILAGIESRRKSLTIEIMQNRQQMLSDLRTMVFQMKRGLLQVMQYLDE